LIVFPILILVIKKFLNKDQALSDCKVEVELALDTLFRFDVGCSHNKIKQSI
jgi:hypothetical protein